MIPTGSNKVKKLLRKLSLNLDADHVITSKFKDSIDGKDQQIIKKACLEVYQEFEKMDDIGAMISAETIQLTKERSGLPASAERINSLNIAITDMEIIEEFLNRVRDHDGYQILATGMKKPKQWSGDLPMDSARMAFRSHATRLQNSIKYSTDEDEIHSLKQRRINVLMAERIYKTMQKLALGPVKAPGRDIGDPVLGQ